MMFLGFIILILFQVCGVVLTQLLHLPLPGPVLGMGLMFLALLWIKPLHALVAKTSHLLLKRMSLFFVPAGVGVVTLLDRLQAQWQALVAVLVISTFITLAVTAYSFHLSRKKQC